MDKLYFTNKEKRLALGLIESIKSNIGDTLSNDDVTKLRKYIQDALENYSIQRDVFGLNPLIKALQTVQISIDEIGLKRDGIIAILLYSTINQQDMAELLANNKSKNESSEILDEISNKFGNSTMQIVKGLIKVHSLYTKSQVIESENFRNLLLSFAEDMRVILIMIAERVNLMRQIRDTKEEEAKRKVSEEASYLYAPLAHKLGLYKLKSELEDLSLKYLEHEAYYMIREKLNATKKSRDAYIQRFITPVRKQLEEAGLKFHMKGRTKSIHSIWQKMKKQQCDFEGIYDLFAIRIIIDSNMDEFTDERKMHSQELKQCWQAYSIVTDMYQPNPKRLRDWLSVPKSNGYESLHITVLGPENKWVEVQIRTERMDNIAERGLAAHWRYKGVKGDSHADNWLEHIRTALEAGDGLQVMDQFKMGLYEDEVFVFTPKGDLYKFPKGATVLDFAYHIHTGVGNSCVGGRINGKVVPIREKLHSGDSVEIITQSNQKPKRDWLNIVFTSRAKSKIRLALKDLQIKDGLLAKETLERRFKNKKIDVDEGTMSHTIKKLGFKVVGDFYRAIAEEQLDINTVIEKYLEVYGQEQNPNPPITTRSAENFNFEAQDAASIAGHDDVLVIDKNLKGVDYSLAKCCHPIYGDSIFGFVTVNGGIKIHRMECPNAPELRKRFGYRVVKARWSGKGTSQYSITLRIIGNDDIGIVNNITSIISKEEKIMMRSINIDSHDGLFSGNLEVMVDASSKMESLIKKLKTVKGVIQVSRI